MAADLLGATAKGMLPFIHLPLRDDRAEIRLVVLLPNNDNESGDIVCRIVHAPLDTDIQYEALSYVWGASEEPRSIQLMGSADCDGTNDKRAFPITPNLHDALVALRQGYSECRVLWIDALCIDQTNDTERSSQVALMRSIYSNAYHTVVHFGSEDEFSALGMEFIKRVATTVHIYRLPKAGLWRKTKRIEGNPVREILKELEALEAVVQFYILVVSNMDCARSNSGEKGCLLLGKHVLLWEAGARTIYALHNYMSHIRETPEFEESKSWPKIGDRNSLALSVIDAAESYRRKGDRRPLMDLLRNFWSSDSTDSKDKVYALLGLATDSPLSAIVPDYSLHFGQVYGMAVKDLMLRDISLDILALCSGTGARRRDGLPTWAPDWTIQGKKAKEEPGYHTFPFFTLPLRRWAPLDTKPSTKLGFHASGQSTIENVRFSNDYRELFLTGVCIDTIHVLSEVRKYRYIKHSAFEEWGKLGDKLSEYPTGEYAPLAFAKTLCADQFEYFEDMILGNVDDHAACVSMVTSGRKFMLTEKGYMGLAVIEAEKGDIICVVSGSKVPVILRKNEDHYLMVGEAYVHGIMQGEVYNGGVDTAFDGIGFRIL